MLQKKSVSKDSESNDVELWIDWRPVWVEPMETTSREFYRLSQQNSEITHVFKVRFMAGIKASHRIRFNNRYLNIIGEPINEGEANQYLLIACKGAT